MTQEDDELERRLGWVLRGGVIVSSVLLCAGLALSFSPAPSAVGAGLLHAGLVVLLATPIARVATSLISYAASRDTVFVALTAIVLLELGAAVVAAIHGSP